MSSHSTTHIDATAEPKFHCADTDGTITLDVGGSDPWQVTTYLNGTPQEIRIWATKVASASFGEES